MKIRIISPGWDLFTGPMAGGTMFKDGVSVGDVDRRLVMRIGASLTVVEVLEDGENGPQVGPSATLNSIRSLEMDAPAVFETGTESVQRIEDEKVKLAADAAKQQEEAAAAFAAAKAKAEAETPVVWTRTELEAIGANDGIDGLREIAAPMGVKARSITDLVKEILAAQTKSLSA